MSVPFTGRDPQQGSAVWQLGPGGGKGGGVVVGGGRRRAEGIL